MPDDPNDIRTIAANAAKTELSSYIASTAFQSAIDRELQGLVSKFESRAKFWSGLAAALFFLVFGAAMGWQILEAKQKQAELSVQYSAASELASRLQITIDEFKSKTQQDLSALDTKIKSGVGGATATLNGLSGQIDIMKTQVENLKQNVDALKAPNKQ